MTTPLLLYSVADWDPGMGCTPTALCAVTGLPKDVVDATLKETAARRGITIESTRSVSPQDWGEALKSLGYHWDTLHDQHRPRPSINEAVRSYAGRGLLLMLAFDDAAGDGHVFASCDRHIVDCWTAGQVVGLHACPQDHDRFLVKFVLRIKTLTV